MNNSRIERDGPSLPGVLRDAGYQTEWVGRTMHQTPPGKRFGFEHMVFKDHRTQDDYAAFLDRREPEGSGGFTERAPCTMTDRPVPGPWTKPSMGPNAAG